MTTCGCSVCCHEQPAGGEEPRPGLDAIVLRGTAHASLLAAMKARLSAPEHRAGLAALAARDSRDPAIAMLDAWATVGDILGFYGERLRNEGYLRTAREPRSLEELARLIGYEARPGVSASTYLSFAIDADSPPVVVPAGTSAQSVPEASSETAQTFETSADLTARTEWNDLKVRVTRPQRLHVQRVDTDGPSTVELVLEQQGFYGIYVEGIATQLKKGDKLLFVAGGGDVAVARTIEDVTPERAFGRTRVALQDPAKLEHTALAQPRTAAVTREPLRPLAVFAGLLQAADKPASAPPISAARVGIRARDALSDPNGDAPMRLLTALKPAAASRAFQALAQADVGGTQDVTVYVLQRATMFGAAAPRARVPPPVRGEVAPMETEWKLPRIWEELPPPPEPDPEGGGESPSEHPPGPSSAGGSGSVRVRSLSRRPSTSAVIVPPPAEASVVQLDGAYETLLRGSFLVLDTEATPLTRKLEVVLRAGDVRVAPRAAYGLAGKVTRVELQSQLDGKPHVWLRGYPPKSDYDETKPEPDQPEVLNGQKVFRFDAVRRSVAYLPGAQLKLVEVPDETPLPEADSTNPQVEGSPILLPLAGVYSDFTPGRWVIITGERADVGASVEIASPAGIRARDGEAKVVEVKAAGVQQSELAMVLSVRHDYDPERPGDVMRSTLVLAQPLAYQFKRDTVRIHGNVVPATHGEKRSEVLGGGDAVQPNQSFTLRQPPLTYVSAATPTGVASTLAITVNGQRYRETPSFGEHGPEDRVYTVHRDDAGKSVVTFGDGEHGARLPSGAENVQARYRNGLGKAGNVPAGRIRTALDRPRGVRDVSNPLPASGGADRDPPSVLRENAPVSTRALERLVSVQDHEDFARTFAGIGKASAVELSDGLQTLVHLTIAGIDDAPILPSSDLFRNLLRALRRYGDPLLPVRLATRLAWRLVIDADVAISSDYVWEGVQPAIVAALLDRFGFARAALGVSVHQSQVLATIQQVPGVAFVHLTTFTAIPEDGELLFLTGGELQKAPRERVEVRMAYAQRDAHAPHRRPRMIVPAGLAYLPPGVPEALTLQEKKS